MKGALSWSQGYEDSLVVWFNHEEGAQEECHYTFTVTGFLYYRILQKKTDLIML